MHICLIMDNPETPQHPVIAVALQKLSHKHITRLFDVRTLTGIEAISQEKSQPLADLYLLKSHAPQALEVARYLEGQGALVVNSWAASVACQDRVLMTQYLEAAHLPWPRTQDFPGLEYLLRQSDVLSALTFPVIIKSRYSHRGDLVGKMHSIEELRALSPLWNEEPVILQEFSQSDGWDIKLWVIDQAIFAARSRTPLEPGASNEDIPLSADELPEDWRRITLENGKTFNLRLYGVDLLMTVSGPVIVDVNSFPGFRGVQGADDALVSLAESLLREKKVSA